MKFFLSSCLLLLVPLSVSVPGRCDQLPSFFYKSVVALGRTSQPQPGGPSTWITEASGFFYAHVSTPNADPSKTIYEFVLVTNRHVLEGHEQIEARLDSDDPNSPPKAFVLKLKDEHGAELWHANRDPSIDVAVARINRPLLTSEHLQSTFMRQDLEALTRDQLREKGYAAGDAIYVLGFPMGLTGKERNYVITRRGAIARISDFLELKWPSFTIDALIFPGNSGGPVFAGPELTSINGTQAHTSAYLIGVVRSYIPYVDVAVSQQTMRPRITFEENSGLAEVLPMDFVNQTIQELDRSQPIPEIAKPPAQK